MRILWLAEVLRDAGLSVVEHSGWKTRGWSDWSPRYGIAHATAAPRSQSDATQVAIVRDGHSTLQGPIANACVDRNGRWHVLAAGRCNTAKVGWGGPASGLGNTYVLGVEACNDNRSEPWPDRQYESYARGWAAICRRMGWAASKVVGHKEHQPGDKSDPTFSMTAFRRRVADLIEEDDVLNADDRKWLREQLDQLVMSRQYRDYRTRKLSTVSHQIYAAHSHSAQAVRELGELRGQVAGLATLVEQLAGMGPSPLTSAQLTALTEAVAAAAREPGERIEAALAAAGDALAAVDDESA